MTGKRVIFGLLALGAATAVAAALVTGAFEKNTRAASPECLPGKLVQSARLGNTPVYVSPAPGSVTANSRTQISFLGVPGSQIGQVTAVGQRSGRHTGLLRPYSQGDGASFVPDAPFRAGERVSVRATIDRAGSPTEMAFQFTVDTPYPTATVKPFPNPAAPPGDWESFKTLPGVQAPALTVTTPDRDPRAGLVMMTNGPGPGQYGPLIYTPQGRLVWFRRLTGGRSAENLSVQDWEGGPHLTMWQGRVLSLGYGQGEDVILDERYRTVARVSGGNGLPADLHDFQLAGEGVAYTTAYNAIRCDLSRAQGARDGAIVDTAVQAIDTRTGLVRWEWHSLDHVGVQESETSPPSKGTPWDWFHLNSVDPLADGGVLISARSTWAAYLLQRDSGHVLWRLGGNSSSFHMGPGTRTAWQHDARMLDDGQITVFDNGSNPRVHGRSRAVRIALDQRTHRASLVSVLVHPNGLLAVSQGNVQTLAGGRTVVGYGSVPDVGEYAADGQLLFDAHMALHMDSYRAFRFPWHALPAEPPAAEASLNNTGEETIVWASFNGATDVAAWRVLAGARQDTLKPRTQIPASGFESSAILPERYAWVAVQALDRAGRVLGASRAVRVGSYAASLGGTGDQQ